MGFKIKETTHVKTSFDSIDYKDLNDAFEAAVNHLGANGGGRVKITMELEVARVD